MYREICYSKLLNFKKVSCKTTSLVFRKKQLERIVYSSVRLKINTTQSNVPRQNFQNMPYTGCPKIKIQIKNFNSDLMITLI